MARHKESEREQIRKQTRQLLLEAAAEEFAREGYQGANINRISTAAGFAKGTIYNYFESKRSLMLALLEEGGANHVAFVIERAGPEDEPEQRLIRFFEAGFAFVSRYLAQSRTMIAVLNGSDMEFRMKMYRAYQPLFQFLGREVIAVGMGSGQFRPVDPEATAALLMNIYLGTASQLDEEGRPWLDPGQVADFALHALRAV